MSTPLETSQHLSSNYDHDAFNIAGAGTMEVKATTGTDTATVRYIGIPGNVFLGINLIPTVALSVTEINNKVLKKPMSVGVIGWTEDKCKITQFKLVAGSATAVEVEVKA